MTWAQMVLMLRSFVTKEQNSLEFYCLGDALFSCLHDAHTELEHRIICDLGFPMNS